MRRSYAVIGVLVCMSALALGGCAAKKLKPFAQPDKESRMRFLKYNSVPDEEINEAIEAGTVIVGMTMDQVVASWGEPYMNFGKRWEYRAWRNIILLFDDQRRVKEIKHFTNF